MAEELKSIILDYFKITENEAMLLEYLLRECGTADVQVQLKTLSLLKGIMDKRFDLETFMIRMVLVKGEDELDQFRKYAAISDEIMASAETLRLRVFTDQAEHDVGTTHAAIHRHPARAAGRTRASPGGALSEQRTAGDGRARRGRRRLLPSDRGQPATATHEG
jgi:hypothetical protein